MHTYIYIPWHSTTVDPRYFAVDPRYEKKKTQRESDEYNTNRRQKHVRWVRLDEPFPTIYGSAMLCASFNVLEVSK